MANEPVIMVKIGGRPAADPQLLTELIGEMVALSESALSESAPAKNGRLRWLFVHGGGSEVSALSARFGLTPVFDNGIRMTSPAEMEIVDMVLAGKVNTAIVRAFGRCGRAAVGVSGADAGLLQAESIGPGNRTGRIASVAPGLLHYLLDGGYLPVISSVTTDAQGGGLNINADEAAQAIAVAMAVDSLVYISDIPGVLQDGRPIAELRPSTAERAIADGVITGGMVPKVRSAAESVQAGVRAVVIGDFAQRGDLAALLAGRRGTTVVA